MKTTSYAEWLGKEIDMLRVEGDRLQILVSENKDLISNAIKKRREEEEKYFPKCRRCFDCCRYSKEHLLDLVVVGKISYTEYESIKNMRKGRCCL